MAISFPRPILTHRKLKSVQIRFDSIVGVNESPYDYVQQTYEFQGERLKLDLVFNDMHRQDAEPWIAWIASLRGSVGSFTAGDPNAATPRGTVSGSPVATAPIRARTLTVTGGAGTLLAGDWIMFQGRWLHKVLVDVTLGGVAFVEIRPGLRAALASSPLTYTNTFGRWMMIKEPSWRIVEGGNFYEIDPIEASEDFR